MSPTDFPVTRAECIAMHRESREDLRDAFSRLEVVMKEWSETINQKLDRINGTVRGHGESIVVLQDRATRAESVSGRGRAFWGSAGALVGGAIVTLVEYFSK